LYLIRKILLLHFQWFISSYGLQSVVWFLIHSAYEESQLLLELEGILPSWVMDSHSTLALLTTVSCSLV